MADRLERLAADLRREQDRAWAAGVIDTCGRLTVLRRHDNNALSPRIRVHSRFGSIESQLVTTLGGRVAYVRGRPVWEVTGAKNCLEVAEAVLPYLRLLGRQAGLLAELCRRIVDYRASGFDQRTLPPEEIEERLRIAEPLMPRV